MKIQSLAVVALLSTLASVPVASAGLRQSENAGGEPRYDPATVISVIGIVVSTREVPSGKPLSGLHLIVKTDSGEIDVYLGPVEFLREFEISFSPGNTVEVIGSRVVFGGGHVVLAREVRKGETYLYLRDHSGRPNWPARRNPPRQSP
jgi:hypothetical protein